MLQVKDGQTDKLGLLFERYNKSLYGFFYRLTCDSNASEDLVQNVFIRILKYKYTFHGDGKFSTWMFHMARNMFADHYKKSKRMGYKEDHSELIIYCPGENVEMPINYGTLFTFYKNSMNISSEGGRIKVIPNDGTFKYANLEISNNILNLLTVVDAMDMSHTYSFSNFSTTPAKVAYTINPRNYAATIDERKGCK